MHATASPVTDRAESKATAEAAPQLSAAPTVSGMLALQRTIGNRAVAQLLAFGGAAFLLVGGVRRDHVGRSH